ncbi:MAG: hypothetical protein SVQ76_02555, partial [Candidatus Nanohaloarchaea archaeon]|nr:hypothetical protein [Candidatus Nanohaloarchaea archaeon]
MGDDVLTFEELRRVQSQENSSDTLTDLEEGFFDRARNYLEVKKEGADPLNNQEYRNARNILQDVLDMRQKKITKLAFLSVKSGVDVNNLLPHEEELFRELEESIGSYRHDIRERVFEVGVEEDAVEREAEELPGEDTGEEEAVEETEEPSPAEEEMTETDVGEEAGEDGEEVEDEEVKSGGEGGEEGEETEEEEQGGGSGPELSGFSEDEEDE